VTYAPKWVQNFPSLTGTARSLGSPHVNTGSSRERNWKLPGSGAAASRTVSTPNAFTAFIAGFSPSGIPG
jgi:hypothetical protein